MAKSYSIILQSIGPNRALLIENITSYSGLPPARAQALLDNLPCKIMTTNSRLKASIVKEALRSLGADVVIETFESASGYSSSSQEESYSSYVTNQGVYNDDSYNKGYRNYREKPEYTYNDSFNPHNVWDNENNARDDFGSNPIQGSPGCLVIIFAGILLVAGGGFVISSVI